MKIRDMFKLFYKIGYIDLAPSLEEIFSSVKTRTEIRKAENNGVVVNIFNDTASDNVYKACSDILKKLLAREYVPYSLTFDSFLRDTKNVLLTASISGEVVSFIVISPEAKAQFFKGHKTAFLGLSGTDNKYKNYCPNYLLIWEAIKFLKEKNFLYFNLGLLTYENCPDPDLERVAFFKRKWNIKEIAIADNGNFLKFFYYRYLKRFRFIKMILFFLKKI